MPFLLLQPSSVHDQLIWQMYSIDMNALSIIVNAIEQVMQFLYSWSKSYEPSAQYRTPDILSVENKRNFEQFRLQLIPSCSDVACRELINTLSTPLSGSRN